MKQKTLDQAAFGVSGDILNNIRSNRGQARTGLARTAERSLLVGGQQAGLDVTAARLSGTVGQQEQLARARDPNAAARLKVSRDQLDKLEELNESAKGQFTIMKNIKETFSFLGSQSEDQKRVELLAAINQG